MPNFVLNGFPYRKNSIKQKRAHRDDSKSVTHTLRICLFRTIPMDKYWNEAPQIFCKNFVCVYFKLITNILIDRVTREADKIKIKEQFHFISIIVVHIKLHKFAGILLLVIRIRAAEKLYIEWSGKQASGNFLGICFVFRQTAHDECEYTPFTHAICFIFNVVCEDSQKL